MAYPTAVGSDAWRVRGQLAGVRETEGTQRELAFHVTHRIIVFVDIKSHLTRRRDLTTKVPEARGYDAEFVIQLYRVFFDREPDPGGFETYINALHSDFKPHEVVASFLHSEEFIARQRMQLVPTSERPNLRCLYPSHYQDE